MKIKRNPLFPPILWSLITACWFAILGIDFSRKSTSEGVVVLHALTAAMSLFTMLLHCLRYRDQKGQL